jgi:hypothetical protein
MNATHKKVAVTLIVAGGLALCGAFLGGCVADVGVEGGGGGVYYGGGPWFGDGPWIDGGHWGGGYHGGGDRGGGGYIHPHR